MPQTVVIDVKQSVLICNVSVDKNRRRARYNTGSQQNHGFI